MQFGKRTMRATGIALGLARYSITTLFRILIMLSRKEVFNDIDAERNLQIRKWGLAINRVEDPDSSNTWKLAVLTEELGEVAKEVVDGSNRIKLRNELTQVAAVAVAWLESL